MKFILWVLVLVYSQLSYALENVVVGGRLQGIMAHDSETDTQDMYLRRTRVNVAYQPWEKHSIVYDVRNDNSNQEDRGDGKFSIGDAYWQIDMDKSYIKNIRLFRAKVDVSYTQTASSKDLMSPNRADVSEYASDYIVSNRRANNVQANGMVGQMAYQIVISDGVDSNEVDTATKGTRTISEIEGQKLTYGGKIRYFFWGDAYKNKAKETFYGKESSFSLGVGRFNSDKVIFKLSDDSLLTTTRGLTNVELSYSKYSFRLLGEYFIFENDIVNLDATVKNKMLATSSGHYILIENLFGKWAPNLGMESFDQSAHSVTNKSNSVIMGLNYYLNKSNLRYGAFYKKTNLEQGQTKTQAENFQIYAMLNF